MKKLYFNSISRTIHEWIEANGNLEFEMWMNKEEEIPRRPDGTLYTDMPFIMAKLITDTMKSGLKISNDMRKPIFTVLVKGNTVVDHVVYK